MTCLVVLLSVLLHGGALAWMGRSSAPEPAATEPGAELIRVGELRALREAGAPVVIGDVRAEAAFEESGVQAQGSVRLSPDRPAEHAGVLGLPQDAWLVLYCT